MAREPITAEDIRAAEKLINGMQPVHQRGIHDYLEVVAFDSDEVVKRIEVTSRSERGIEQAERGMQHNLNHDLYYTRRMSYDKSQELNPAQP